jgi:uncharacterized protein YlxW (UPF0749 family)
MTDNMNVFEGTLFELIREVVKSWQVLAVTVVLVFYLFLVNKAARVYKYRRSKPAKTFKHKKKAKTKTAAILEETDNIVSSNDELGLEE